MNDTYNNINKSEKKETFKKVKTFIRNCLNKYSDTDIVLDTIRKRISYDSCHGMTNEDFNLFKTLLGSVSSTDAKGTTEFPDYLGKNGFIECFEVSQFGTFGNKGYIRNAYEGAVSTKYAENIINEDGLIDITKCNDIETVMEDIKEHTPYKDAKSSHGNFLLNFKCCWEKHIDSMHEKYKDNLPGLSCFLIISDDNFNFNGFRNSNIEFGDLLRCDHIRYCLALDTKLLNYIYNYGNYEIDFVVYFNKNTKYIEVIKVSNVPKILEYIDNFARTVDCKFAINGSHGF